MQFFIQLYVKVANKAMLNKGCIQLAEAALQNEQQRANKPLLFVNATLCLTVAARPLALPLRPVYFFVRRWPKTY